MRRPSGQRLSELRRQNEQFRHLCGLTAEIARLGDERATLKRIVDTAADLIGVDGVHVALVDRDDKMLYGVVSSGRRPFKPPLKLDLSQCPAARQAIRGGTHVIIEDAADDPRVNSEARERLGIGSVAYIPLLSGKAGFGVLVLNYRKMHRFKHGELEIARHFASLAAVALENARLMNHLVETEQRLRSLVEHIPAIVYVCEVDPPFRTLYISPQVSTILGYAPEEWLSDPTGLFMKVVHPDDKDRVIDWTAESVKTRGVATSEYRMRDRWGEMRWFRDEAVLVRDPSSTPVAWHGVIVEITGIKKATSH